MTNFDTVILGGGVTGLAAGICSGFPIFEAQHTPGGICSSYYMQAGNREKLSNSTKEQDCYRFEHGGGHWIFGGDPAVLSFINSFAPTKDYQRSSAVFFPQQKIYTEYPLQNNLHSLGKDIATKAITEIATAPRGQPQNMAEWLEQSFGTTLSKLFFAPFHELYTAGLWTQIKPQDAYKSPDSLQYVIKGAFDQAPAVGYNVTFVYPQEGLNTLALRMAEQCNIHYNKKVIKIDTQSKEIHFSDKESIHYKRILSTLPLNYMCDISGTELSCKADPYTSVLVVNIGGLKGSACPKQHWIYVPSSNAGFHRIGFYSNVDQSFVPKVPESQNELVSIYAEKAYLGGYKPSAEEIQNTCQLIISELQAWGMIKEVEVVDPTWIDVAYTWSWVGSSWKQLALSALEKVGIFQVGRYGRWIFQGIADSIRDGFAAATALKQSKW